MYYYILILLSFVSFQLRNLKIKNQATYLLANSYVFFFLIFFISSLRYNVGTDFFSYQKIFTNDNPIEPLFFLLIQAIKTINGNYQLFVFIVFLLSFGFKLYSFSKLSYSKGFFLTVMLFCSFYYIAYDMNAIRQGLALASTLLACYYAYIKKKTRFYVTCIAATLVHYTAFVFLPFYILLDIKITKKVSILICLACILLSLYGIFDILINISTSILGNNIIAYQIKAYSVAEGFANNLLISSSTIRRLFFFALILFSYEKIDAPNRIKQIIFWGGFISIIIYILFAEVGYFSTRLSVYYRITECIWLSYFPFIFKKKYEIYNYNLLFFIFFASSSFSFNCRK